MSKSLIPNEKAVIENGWNVMLIGAHGTGKSATVRSLASRHGLKVAIFNAATMDPHTELLGIPMPRMVTDKHGNTREVLKMIRPIAIDEADVIFLDELNRAPVETQNACMEMANERTINGEPLPNLKMVVTAINPPDGNYNVGLIDEAMADRWDIYVEVVPEVDASVLTAHDGLTKPVADALAQWYAECNHAKRETYVSPRRVAKLGKVFEATKSKKMLQACLPPGTTADTGKLFAMLMTAAGTPLAGSKGDAKLAATREATFAADGSELETPVSWIKAKHVNPAMIKRVEAAAKKHSADLCKHFIDMPQSTSYRFGKKLGEMLESGAVSPVEVAAIVHAFDSFASMKGAKRIADHARSAR
jgi:hypothetical protein